METVEDRDGRRYHLVKRSHESSLVRDVETGEHQFKPNDTLAVVDGIDPLIELAQDAPPGARAALDMHNLRALGMLVALDTWGPTSVSRLLDRTSCCESELFATVRDLETGGLLEECTVDGERGYAVTESVTRVLED